MRTLAFFAIIVYLAVVWLQAVEAAKEWYDYYQEGLMAMKAEKWGEAAELFQKAITGNPQPKKRVVTPGNWILTDYYPYLQSGIAYLRLGQPDVAEKHLNKAIAFGVEPRVEVYKYLAEVDDMKKRLVENRPSKFIEEEPPDLAPVPPEVPTPMPEPTTILETTLAPVQKSVLVVPPIPTSTPGSISEVVPTPVQELSPTAPLPPIPTTDADSPPITPTMITPIPTSTLLTGNLYIDSVPSGGAVFLNRQKKGETPLSLDKLREGAYEVEIVKQGYPVYRAKAAVIADQTSKYVYTLGPYDCDYNSSPDQYPSGATSLENFMKSGQVAEVNYDNGDCTDWFSLEIQEEAGWIFEIQLLDNLQANIELRIYGPDSDTTLSGSGTRIPDDPGAIRFVSEVPVSPGLYYILVRAKGKGDRVLYNLRSYTPEAVTSLETPLAENVTPTPFSTPSPVLFPVKTGQDPQPKIKWPQIFVKNPYALLGLASVIFGLAFAVILINRKSKSKGAYESSFEKVRGSLARGVEARPTVSLQDEQEPQADILENDDEALFLMKLDARHSMSNLNNP